jgi:tetratricopeptide (TPR) repeat protein
MKVAYQVHPTPTAEAAVALLLPGRKAADVLGLCAELALDPLPPIYRVADGYLVKLPQPRETPLAGVVRLRGLAPDLLLPVDAELIPPLLPDEAAALVRQRGLVVLPGGRVLEYRPDQPLALGELLHVGAVHRGSRQALPEPPALADDVTEIALDVPSPSPDLILETGGEGIATEDPEIPEANLPSKVAGNTLFSLGKGMAWLGNALHIPGLAGLGAKLLAGALSLVPRLSQELLGKQEAMLRNLLREFREGNIEKALRRALPLGADDRGSAPAQDAQLPTHDTRYSLGALLGDKGPASLWFGGQSAFHELIQEYRKHAEQAAQRGDFRRAAFIYGKLLRDYRSAALVLARGGLHRDAAVLYEQKLQDPRSAATQWETAGEIDRALRLYLKLGDHAQAGDLLRRAGEEERALGQYHRAAAKLIESGSRYYEAGQLLEHRAQHLDLALLYYRAGWEVRPDGSPLQCALRLARHDAARGESHHLLQLTTEADAFLEPSDVDSASTFYNELARLADTPALEPVAAELRDRARLGLARKMSKAGGTRDGGNLVAALFPAESAWPAPLVRDAQHALRQPGRRGQRAPRESWTLRRVRPSVVRAVHQLPASKDVYLGLENGEVVCYRPKSGEIVTITREQSPILSLASCGSDDYLVVLSNHASFAVRLTILARSNGYRMLNYQQIATDERAVWLCTHVVDNSSHMIGVCLGHMFYLYRAPELTPQTTLVSSIADQIPVAAVLGLPHSLIPGAGAIVFYPGFAESYSNTFTPATDAFALPWTPASCGNGALPPMLHAVWNDGNPMEVIGLDQHGGIRMSQLRHPSTAPETTTGWTSGEGEPFQAFARLRANLVAGVTCTAVHWLRDPSAFPAAPPSPVRLTRPVAAFAMPAGDLLIVEADCTLTRVPGP